MIDELIKHRHNNNISPVYLSEPMARKNLANVTGSHFIFFVLTKLHYIYIYIYYYLYLFQIY